MELINSYFDTLNYIWSSLLGLDYSLSSFLLSMKLFDIFLVR